MRPLFFRTLARPMTQTEHRRFMVYYWVYTIIWVALALMISFIPVPSLIKWGLAGLLALGTPAGGQFESYSEYIRWRQDHVIDKGEDADSSER